MTTSPESSDDRASAQDKNGAAANAEEQLIFTRNVSTGAVIKIERIDPTGTRTDITKSETLALAGKDNLLEIEAVLDDAFEAGISSVLASMTEDDDEDDESDEEMELRRVFLTDIVGRQVRRKLQRKLVQRLILARTLPH